MDTSVLWLQASAAVVGCTSVETGSLSIVVTTCVAIIAMIVGAFVSVLVQIESARNQLRLDAYKQVCDITSTAADAITSTDAYLQTAPMTLRKASEMFSAGFPGMSRVNFDLQKFTELYTRSNNRLLDVRERVYQYLNVVNSYLATSSGSDLEGKRTVIFTK